VVVADGDRVVSVVVLWTRGGRIASVYAMASPERLGRLRARWPAHRHDAPVVASW